MKIYLLLLAFLLCSMSFAQLRGSAANRGGLSSLGSSGTNQGTGEEAESNVISLDIESGDVFEENIGEPDIENEVESEGIIEEEALPPQEETPIAGGWEPVDVSQAESSPDFKSVYDYAVDYVMEQAYQATLLTGNYSTKKIMNAYRQEANGINYKIDCEVYNEEGKPVKVSVLAWYQKETNSREMRNFTYAYKNINEADYSQSDVTVGWDKETGNYAVDIVPDYASYPSKQPEHYDLNLTGYLAMGGYNPVPVEEIYNDKDLENYVKYGAQEIVKYGKGKGYLNQDYAYNVKEVQSLYGQWNEDRSNKWYRCEIELDDGAGGSAVASYEVNFQAGAERPEIPTLGFKRIQNN
jgi:hypothetical protein